MTGISQTSIANVEYTLNAWMAGQLATLSRPSILSTMPAIAFDYPDNVASVVPVFSFVHMPIDANIAGLGGVADSDGTHGQWMRQMFWIGCWVTRADPNWSIQLRTMVDMVMTVYNASSAQVIKDFVANNTNPASTNYIVQFLSATIEIPPGDPNVDIRRRDVHILYTWVFRN